MPPYAAAARLTSRSYGLSPAGLTTSTSRGAETTARAEKAEPAIEGTGETRAGLMRGTAEASAPLCLRCEGICRFSAPPAKALAALCEGRCRATPITMETSITEMRQETGRKATGSGFPKPVAVTVARREAGRNATYCKKSISGALVAGKLNTYRKSLPDRQANRETFPFYPLGDTLVKN